MKKTILIYHGLGSTPNKDRIKTFIKRGYNVISDLHDYHAEWNKDQGKSFMDKQIELSKSVDLILGISFGGYIAYELAKIHNIPCLLINPAIDRDKSKSNIKHYNFISGLNEPMIEVYYGVQDTNVDPLITLEYLEKNYKNYSVNPILKMAHRVPHVFFSKIIKSSKLV